MNQGLGEYSCPMCDLNLTGVKSSYLRQQHVEKCMLSMTETTKVNEEKIEFSECVFCGKNLSHFKYSQKQVHLNSCLDNEKELEVTEFAGQPISFLSTLDICPVCHEVSPFIDKNLNQKLKHTKKCAKNHRLTLSQLLQKFQWIGWGHLPVPSTSMDASVTMETNIPLPQQLKSTHIYNDILDENDDDFSTNVVIHKQSRIPNEKRSREEDKNDQELQFALSLSKSMCPSNNVKKKKLSNGITPLNEREWNSANIWSIEESRKQVFSDLDEMLFPTNNEIEIYKQNEREKSIGYLNSSKLSKDNSNDFYWNLTSNKDNNWNKPFIFQASFIRQLKII
jgi:hypothetical protein